MQFKVPQFIDIEDKVFGPLTFKQFAYLAGGAGFGDLAFHFLPIFLSLFIGPAIVGFALALAFMTYNDKPFIHVVESFVKYYSRSRLYLWHKAPSTTASKFMTTPSSSAVMRGDTRQGRATMSESKLKTLSWSVDVIGSKK
jgi:hypothetical protein